MKIPWHRFACPWWHAYDILRWNKGLKCSAFIFFILQFFFFSSHPFFVYNLQPGYLQIMFHIDEAKQRSPWTGTNNILSYSCLVLGVSNPVQNNVLDLEVSVGAFRFLTDFLMSDALLYIKLGTMASNFLHHLMSQNTRKNEKVNLLNLTPYNIDFWFFLHQSFIKPFYPYILLAFFLFDHFDDL